MRKYRGRILITVLVVAVIGVAGYFTWTGYLRYVPPTDQTLRPPEIEGVSYRWGGVSTDSTQMIFEVTVKNPNTYAIRLTAVNYHIYFNGILMGEGSTERDTLIGANAEVPVSLVASIDNALLPQWWVSHIEGGESSLMEAEMEVVFNMGGTSVPVTWRYESVFSTDILTQAGTE